MHMESAIRRWGNGAAVRLSADVMKRARFNPDQRVTITVMNGKITIEALKTEELSLGELLDQITPENIHQGIDVGGPVGEEIL